MAEHEQAHCQQGPLCKGPGCRVSNGKTATEKANGYQSRRRDNQLRRVGNPQNPSKSKARKPE
jgi:hypothetical protein